MHYPSVRSSPNALLFGSVCFQGSHAAGTDSECGHRKNVDWIFSDVGVLYMNRWNGLDNDALKGSFDLTP